MKDTYLKAKAYVLEKGSKFQQAYAKWLEGEVSQAQLISELKAYQNEDGGFAHGLEIEYQGEASATITVAAALGYMARIGIKGGEVYDKTVAYLKAIQGEDGSFDDEEKVDRFPHPDYMGKGIYVPYKTGVALKWLMIMGCKEKDMIEAAYGYMEREFSEVSKTKDIWNALGYIGAFVQRMDLPIAGKVIEWCTSVFMGEQQPAKWMQYSGRIEAGEAIMPEEVDDVLREMKANQESDGGWQQPFGEYNRVWQAVFMMQFMKEHHALDK